MITRRLKRGWRIADERGVASTLQGAWPTGVEQEAANVSFAAVNRLRLVSPPVIRPELNDHVIQVL
jgi:hypothetical protein